MKIVTIKATNLQRILRKAKVKVLLAQQELQQDKEKATQDSQDSQDSKSSEKKPQVKQETPMESSLKTETKEVVEEITDPSKETPSAEKVDEVLKKEQFSSMNELERFIKEMFGSLKGLLQELGLGFGNIQSSMRWLGAIIGPSYTGSKGEYASDKTSSPYQTSTS